MGSPTFNPTFTHAFYRAANVGCVRRAIGHFVLVFSFVFH